MKSIEMYVGLLLLLFSCFFLSASFRCKRQCVDESLQRMERYNAFLCSVVDNSFRLLRDGQKNWFVQCPFNGNKSFVISISKASGIVLKVDKIVGWSDGIGVGDTEVRANNILLLDRVIIEHTSALNEYMCYLEGADLDHLPRDKKKLMSNGRFSVLDGFRTQSVELINYGFRTLRNLTL